MCAVGCNRIECRVRNTFAGAAACTEQAGVRKMRLVYEKTPVPLRQAAPGEHSWGVGADNPSSASPCKIKMGQAAPFFDGSGEN